MLDNEPTNSSDPTAHSADSTPSDEHGAAPARRRRSPAKKTAAAPVTTADVPETAAPARRRTAKKTSAAPAAAVAPDANSGAADSASHSQAAVPSGRKKPTTATKVATKSPAKRPARAAAGTTGESTAQPGASEPGHPVPAMSAIPTILFQPPSVENAIARPARQRRDAAADDRPT
ncbi:MAG: hypothetical protein QOF44_4694, partial [Streptomyces sp.]|nr:hypothetical protein [Streptomyces sp.]